MSPSHKKTRRNLCDPYRVDNGKRFRLADVNPADTGGLPDERSAGAFLAQGIEQLNELQGKLYAQDRWALLVVIQAMDAAGKDGTIKHVLSGVNPQGVDVASFKQPSVEELDHDWLWRAALKLPERGKIQIFNRSYYEEVLIVRVHPGILASERIPDRLVGKKIWEERYRDIHGFERHLARNGTHVIKFMLHISKAEQKRRFLERLDQPAKNWKFSMGDIAERKLWKDYMHAYEDMIRATATTDSPWYVVPADHKWFARAVVCAAIVRALQGLDLRYPVLDPAHKRELASARRALTRKD
jgi:PPK2 family polyphosphate:nucleotide phosphotransferase